MKSKLEKKRRTNEYRAYQIKELAATDTVRKFAVRKRATITEEQSAFKAYANAYTISNIHVKGLNGLTSFPYQFERLNAYLEKHKGMKLNATVKILVISRLSHYVNIICCSRLFNSQKVNFVRSLTFANIVIMVLELKNYSINIMIRDVRKLKDNKQKCLLLMKNGNLNIPLKS